MTCSLLINFQQDGEYIRHKKQCHYKLGFLMYIASPRTVALPSLADSLSRARTNAFRVSLTACDSNPCVHTHVYIYVYIAISVKSSEVVNL